MPFSLFRLTALRLMLWVGAAVPVHGANLMVNSEFSEGLAGWNEQGSVFTTGENAILSDQGGARVVVFQTVAVPVETTRSLQLSFDFLNALSPVVGLGQTPDSVFISAFIGSQPFGTVVEAGVYEEAIGLLDADYRGSVNFAAGLTVSASPKGAGWVRHSVPLPVVPFVTVAFEFIEGNTTPGDSSGAVDNVYLIAEPIPEPGVGAILLMAGAMLILRRRRRWLEDPGLSPCAPGGAPRRRTGRASGPAGARRLGCVRLAVAAGLAWVSGTVSRAQDPVPPTLDATVVRTTAKAERSTLDRTTGVLTSTIDLETVNIGTQRIDGPVHALVRFRDTATGAEVVSGITVRNALGGTNRPPHQVPYFDLSPQAAGGWTPSETLSFTLIFSRPRTVNVTYQVTLAGFLNSPPSLDAGGPYTGRVGEPIAFAATASDPDGDPLTFLWDFGDGTTAETSAAEHIYADAGVKSLRVTVNDGRGGVAERDVSALVSPDGEFALAHTRVVDGVGHPLAGAIVEETGPEGARRLVASEAGFVSLGTIAGEYTWLFSAPGHQPVWRTAALADGAIRPVPSPWLAADGEALAVSVLDASVLDTGSGPGSVRVEFPPGAFAQPGSARLTRLGPQTLPFPLPFGWSPLAAFQLDLPETPTLPGTTKLDLLDPLGPGEFLTIVRYEPEARTWRVIDAGTAPDPAQPAQYSFALTTRGAYAAVVRDEGTGAPTPVAVGEPLPAGTPQELTTRVAAVGLADPPQKAASLDPTAVTSLGQAVFTPATGVLPSGSWFRLAVQETYDLADGSALRTPDYDTTVYAYRRPPSTVAPAEGVTASRSLKNPAAKLYATAAGEGRPVAYFPLRPQLLFGPSDLKETRLHLEVLPPLAQGSAALSGQGGALESGDLRLTIPAGALSGFAVGSLRTLDPAAFPRLAGSGHTIVRAFELNLGGLIDGAPLQLSLGSPLASNAHFALARLVRFPGGSGLTPVQRFHTNAAGLLSSSEPPTPPRLPGLTGAGLYLLVQLSAPQGLVEAVVRQADTSPAPGIAVRIPAQPWLGLTDASGRSAVLAPAGPGSALASHPTNGDGATAGFTMTEPLDPVSLSLTLGALPPRLVATTPPEGALNVSPVSPIGLEFSEKLAPVSLGATPVALRAEGSSTDIPGGATLDLTGRQLTFLPTAPLAPGVTHTLTITGDLRDLQGLALEGPRSATFTTSPPASRGQGAQLTLYEPGATGPSPADQALLNAIPGYTPGTTSPHVAAIGSPGSADPEVPVILVNESTGTTATVLSKTDGSFANFIEAEESDFVSATFVNANGTRITIPATRQKFDDGRIGLYQQGGILEAESDGEPVEIIVEPGSVSSRTVFRVESLDVQEVAALTGGVVPEVGRLLGGIKYQEEGDLTTLASDLVFPVLVTDLGLPEGLDPADATYALTVARKVDGTVVYEMVDAMHFRPTTPGRGELVTASPPFVGLLLREIAAIRQATGFSDTMPSVSRTLADGVISTLLPIGILAVPVVIADAAASNVHGTVRVNQASPPETPADQQDPGRPLAGALVRLAPPGIDFLPNALRAGEFIGTSDAEGKYAMRLPLALTGQLVATHRRFPFQTQRTGFANQNFIAGLRGDFTFTIPLLENLNIPDTSRPLIDVRQLSSVATLGNTPTAGLVLDVTAVDDIEIADVTIQLEDFTSLVGNLSLLADMSPEEQAALQPTLVSSDDDFNAARSHERYRVQSRRAGRAEYRVTATDGSTLPSDLIYTVVFTAAELPPEANQTRRVSFIWPPNAAVFSEDPDSPSATRVARGTPIRIRFSSPLDPGDQADTSWLTLGPEGVKKLHVEVTPDAREIIVYYWVPEPTTDHLTLHISPQVANQEPVQADEEDEDSEAPIVQPYNGYLIRFVTPPGLEVAEQIPPDDVFSGVVQTGNRVYVLTRSNAPPDQSPGRLLHYRLVPGSAPDEPSRLEKQSELELLPSFGRPQDLVLAPSYPIRHLDGSVEPETTYLIAYGGNITGATEGVNALKKAHIFKLGEDGAPAPLFVGGNAPALSEGVATVTRARWDPPFLGYLEIGSEATSVVLTTLNGLMTGREAVNAGFFANLAVGQGGQAGIDLDNDGDFADPGEKAPIPAKQPGVLQGLEFSYSPLDPQDRLTDYDFSADFGLMGAVFRNAVSGRNGFVMILGGSVGQVDDDLARVTFDEDPKRVQILPRQPLLRPANDLGGAPTEILRDIALVSCVRPQSADDRSVLIVIDISNPAAPAEIGRAFMPAGIGTLNSLVPRGDGLFSVSTTPGGLFVLDPRLLLLKDAEGTTAAIRQQIPGLETNARSFVSTASGLHVGNQGNHVTAALSQPTLNVVRFDALVPEAAQAIASDIAADPQTSDAKWSQRLTQAVNVELNAGARTFDPSFANDPRSHFYVLVQTSGDVESPDPDDPPGSIRLAAASVQESGLPLLPAPGNRAPTFIGEEQITKELVFYGALKAAHFLADIDFTQSERRIIEDLGDKMLNGVLSPEILIGRLLQDAPDYPSELLAHRLSNNPTSPLYNTFLAGPIVLCHKDAPSDVVAADQGAGGVHRSYLRASPYYWVGLAPSQRSDPIVGKFASTQIDDLDVTLDLNLDKLDSVFLQARELVSAFTTGGLANLVLELTTLVDAELERSMHPGHVALVNFGFRRNPVVFIPGVMASRLRDPALVGEAGDAVWVSAVAGLLAHFSSILPSTFTPDAVINLLQARVNKLTMAVGGQPVTVLDTQDILRRLTLQEVLDDIAAIPVIGSLIPSGAVASLLRPFLEEINKPIYQPLLLFLQSQQGYVEYLNDGGQDALSLDGAPNWESLKTAPDFFVYPYDWRRDNAESAAQLAKYVDLIAAVHPDTPRVDILAHSMGGLVARRFVLENPHRVERFISICSPFLGATKALYAARTGDFDEVAMSVLVPPERLRVIGRHMPSVHQLMPNRGLHDLGLVPLRELGWDLDGDGDTRERLGYEDYKTAMDGEFLRFSPDTLPPPANPDRPLLETHPRPISSFNQPFYDHTGAAPASGSQYDWKPDSGDIRYIHFVCLQSAARTISTLEARPVLVPEPLEPDVSLSLPPIEFFDSEEKLGADLPILPEVTQGITIDPEKAYRLTWTPEIKLGAGDVTVPFLSQARGFGSLRDFNARGAQVYPLLNPDGKEEHDEFVSHNGVFTNPQLWAWVSKALDDAIVAEAQPKVEVSGGPVTEGSPATFTAVITNPPVTDAPRRVYWDMGDGTVLEGNPVSVSHTYADDGLYTVSVCVSWEPGLTVAANDPAIAARDTFAATDALQITVADSNPVLAIEAPSGEIRPGSLTSFRLSVDGAFGADVEAFHWDFGDGSPTATLDPQNFVVEHVFTRSGTFVVQCEMIDEDGSTSTATTQVTVGLQPQAAQANPQPTSEPPPPEPPASPESGERLEIRVVGHQADPAGLSIVHDGRLVYDGDALIGSDSSVLRLVAAEPGDATLPAVEYIDVPRLNYVDTSIVIPDETIIEITGERPQMQVRMRHVRPNAPPRCYVFRFAYDDNSLPFGNTVEFRINWNQLPSVTNASVGALADLGSAFLFEDAAVERCDDRPPSINFSRHDADDTLRITTADDTVPDGAAADSDDTELAVGLPGPPSTLEDLTGPDGSDPTTASLEGEQVYQATSRTATNDAPPGLTLPFDMQQNTRLPAGEDCPKTAARLTDQDIADIQSAVQSVFAQAAAHPVFQKFVFSLDDLWILEQGSGALLWKATSPTLSAAQRAAARQKLEGVYVKGKSDNDYEVFLPVFKNPSRRPDVTDAATRQRFPSLAHSRQMMEGDWYFLRPVGLLDDGTELGPLPDFEDTEEFTRYVGAAARWQYNIPGAGAPEGRPLSGDSILVIPKGARLLGEGADEGSVFDQPATPAEVVSYVLTRLLTSPANAQLRKNLPDASFFPFRQDHFNFGYLSLEKPPPFGDDPVGDAGMGRQLLLLKWLLEGAFLPAFAPGFNAQVADDLQKRQEIFQRLAERSDSVSPEGFEWGLYQQWAALKEASHYRVRPEGLRGPGSALLKARAQHRSVFGNYLDAHDQKVLKKVGKACIRAALARLAADPGTRPVLFGFTPGAFDSSPDLRSFEHFIAAIATQEMAGNDSLFPNFEASTIRDFLDAKLGSADLYCRIKSEDDGMEGFIFDAHVFLTQVQQGTRDAYRSWTHDLIDAGRLRELEVRRGNARAMDFGFTGIASSQPGREQLLGRIDPVELTYPFIVSVSTNSSGAAIGGIRVILSPGGNAPEIICPDGAPLVIPAGSNSVTLKHKDADGDAVLSLRRLANNRALQAHQMRLVIEDSSHNSQPDNDTARLESELLGVQSFSDRNLVPENPTVILYRGLGVDQAGRDQIIEQLRTGRLISAARRNAYSDELARSLMLDGGFDANPPAGIPPANLDGIRDQMDGAFFPDDTIVSPFVLADTEVMSETELVALWHSDNATHYDPCISFTPSVQRASFFASVGNVPHSLLVAIEVDSAHPGIEYLTTRHTGPDGQPLKRKINIPPGGTDEPLDEIIFFDQVGFIRAHLYAITANPPGSRQFEFTLIESFGAPAP